jgi:hypothetical protein
MQKKLPFPKFIIVAEKNIKKQKKSLRNIPGGNTIIVCTVKQFYFDYTKGKKSIHDLDVKVDPAIYQKILSKEIYNDLLKLM